jgi:hypothetical protein
MNKYKTSTGELISQATIDRRRSQTYRELYEGNPHPSCGCGVAAQGTAHLTPQKVCKDIGKAEYCYLKVNMIPACHKCNSRIENISSVTKDDWFYEQLLTVTKLISNERYLKIIL